MTEMQLMSYFSFLHQKCCTDPACVMSFVMLMVGEEVSADKTTSFAPFSFEGGRRKKKKKNHHFEILTYFCIICHCVEIEIN